jgi:hypothetical protein
MVKAFLIFGFLSPPLKQSRIVQAICVFANIGSNLNPILPFSKVMQSDTLGCL